MQIRRGSLRAYNPGIMQLTSLRLSLALAAGALMVVAPSAQQVTTEQIRGISTFARLETTIACGGATKAEAIPELKKMVQVGH